MRHSVYNDYAAQTRVAMFKDYGLSMEEIAIMGLGPILFSEETKFLKEIRLSEQITVNCTVLSMSKDGSRWTFQHEIFKDNNQKAAVITVKGAWLDLDERSLAIPPEKLQKIIFQLPKADEFTWNSQK
jgi:acyl-CoA thioester hydrolase